MRTGEELFSRNPPGIRDLLRKKVFGVAGCGGLGSQIAVMLVRSGAEELILADGDRVEPSNLNRQAYFQEDIGKPKVTALAEHLGRIRPEVRIHPVNLRLDRENLNTVFGRADVLFEALDGADGKAMVFQAIEGEKRLLVGASGLGGDGPISEMGTVVLAPGRVVCGSGAGPASDAGDGFLASRVTAAAALQVHAALRILEGKTPS